MKINKIILFLFLLSFITGCKLIKGQRDKYKSTADILLGSKVPETTAGTYLELLVGGDAGTAITKYMDKQVKKLNEGFADAYAERISEGIYITFGPACSFEVNSTELSESLKNNLKVLEKVAHDYEETDIIIEGHTDSTGTNISNLELAAQRAKTAASYANSQGLDKYRMTTISYGEDSPVKKRKRKNKKNIMVTDRRIEIVIIASRKLKVLAKHGDL